MQYRNYTNEYEIDPKLSAERVMAKVFETFSPKSCVDIGCGRGRWLQAARKFGTEEVYGYDGVNSLSKDCMDISFEEIDLEQKFDFGRRFELGVCLEVVEHLTEKAALHVIDQLTKYCTTVLFSAAVPGQPGQGHRSCAWPIFWQNLFNARGFTCDGNLRLVIWDDQKIDPWYRQNIFIASRHPENAGKEPRLVSIIHPDMVSYHLEAAVPSINLEHERAIRNGLRPVHWYFTTLIHALITKVRRFVE